LYKGPDVDQEIAEAKREADRLRLKVGIAMRFELPEGMGSRTIIEIAG
jgi:hypothetical protein